IADDDALLPHDCRALPDQGVAADRDDLGVTQLVRRRHTGREARIRAEQRPFADADVALAEQRGDREADRASGAEAAEATSARARGTDRAPIGEPLPHALDDVAGETAQPFVELRPLDARRAGCRFTR